MSCGPLGFSFFNLLGLGRLSGFLLPVLRAGVRVWALTVSARYDLLFFSGQESAGSQPQSVADCPRAKHRNSTYMDPRDVELVLPLLLLLGEPFAC